MEHWGKTAISSCFARSWQHSQDVEQWRRSRDAIPVPEARNILPTLQMWLQLPFPLLTRAVPEHKGVMGRDEEVALYLLHPDPQWKPGPCARWDKAERSQERQNRTGVQGLLFLLRSSSSSPCFS